MTPTLALIALLYLAIVTAPAGCWEVFSDDWEAWDSFWQAEKHARGLREAEKRKANERTNQ